MTEGSKSIEVSRRIEAPAALIFEILANPRRHMDFDGSDMLRAVVFNRPISDVGDTFTMKMNRLGRDYLMLNYVVEFEPDRRIFWEPAPGDLPTAGGDPSKVGIPAGYRWGYILTPDGDDATVVTEVSLVSAPYRRRTVKPSYARAGSGSTGPMRCLSP